MDTNVPAQAAEFPVGARVRTAMGCGYVLGIGPTANARRVQFPDGSTVFFHTSALEADDIRATPETACVQLARTAGFKMPPPLHRNDPKFWPVAEKPAPQTISSTARCSGGPGFRLFRGALKHPPMAINLILDFERGRSEAWLCVEQARALRDALTAHLDTFDGESARSQFDHDMASLPESA